MNYSEYFENKVAAALSNKINLVILKTKAVNQLDFISETRLLDSMEQVWSLVEQLDPYNVLLEDNTVTLKVMDYGKEKVQ
jgi:hypothetical protein